jgi:hypothetical protein
MLIFYGHGGFCKNTSQATFYNPNPELMQHSTSAFALGCSPSIPCCAKRFHRQPRAELLKIGIKSPRDQDTIATSKK